MAKCHPVTPASKGAGLEQRIFHPSGLLLHGGERLADLDRTHVRGAQVAHLLYLQKVKKGVGLGQGEEASLLPCRQLSRR